MELTAFLCKNIEVGEQNDVEEKERNASKVGESIH